LFEMAMVLEYPFKIFILIVVVIVIISIMWQFRDRIIKICLFPPCEKDVECNIQPIIATESEFSEVILDKYCSLCWMKNLEGECKGNSICYILNLQDDFEPGDWNSEYDYCIVSCDEEAPSLYVQYDSEGEGFIEIAC